MNTYLGLDGRLQAHVQVRSVPVTKGKKEPRLYRVVDRSPTTVAEFPDTRLGVTEAGHWENVREGITYTGYLHGGTVRRYTRIWLGVSPPKGTDPGYCAVVGEEYDGQNRAVQRKLFLLDEAVALEVDASQALLPDLFAAVAAAKDLYQAKLLYLDPREEQFLHDLQQLRWGICAYEADLNDDELHKRFPFFARRGRVTSPVPAPYGDDEEYGRRVVGSMMGRGILKHHPCCEVFKSRSYLTPHRALSLVCLAMQSWDWNTVIGDEQPSDGYQDLADVDDADELPSAWELADNEMARLCGLATPGMRSRLLRLRDGADEDGSPAEIMEEAMALMREGRA